MLTLIDKDALLNKINTYMMSSQEVCYMRKLIESMPYILVDLEDFINKDKEER